MKPLNQGVTVNASRPVRQQRKLRNYLIDVSLQLRYTAIIASIAALLTAGLGYMIYQSTRDTSQIIEMTEWVDPVTAAQMKQDFASNDQMVLWGIVGFGLVLVLSVSAAGILVTHKIAGPLFNIARIFDRVREDRLGPPLRQLRKGDELQEFYGRFQQMHEALRGRAERDRKSLQDAIKSLENLEKQKGAEDLREVIALLQALYDSKSQSLDSSI